MHLADDDLVLHYYGELPARDEAAVDAHLRGCAECQDAYRRLQRTMAAIERAGATAFEPPDGFERRAWARLEPALPRASGWRGWLALSPAALALAASVLVLVGGAFMAGRLSSTAGAPATAAAQDPARIREGVLLVDLSDHLDRTQMVLVELVSAGSAGEDDLSTERARAQDLVAAGRLYRQTAAESGDAQLVDVLDQLERVLVDVAAAPAALSPADLDAVRQRIESGNLLFKVRVISSDLHAREKTVLQKRTASEL